MITYLLVIPLIAAAICYPIRSNRLIGAVAVTGSAATLGMATCLSYIVFTSGTLDEGLLYMDAFSAYTLMLVSIVSLACNPYIRYPTSERRTRKGSSPTKLKNYYLFLRCSCSPCSWWPCPTT